MNKIKKILKNKISFEVGTVLLLAVVVLVGIIVYAGSLTPPNSLTNTMYSLTDIDNLVNNGTQATAPGSITPTPGSIDPNGTGKSLNDIYTDLNTQIGKLSSSVLVAPVSVFGITGTAVAVTPDPVFDTNGGFGRQDLNTARNICASYGNNDYHDGAWRLPTYPELVNYFIKNGKTTPSGFQNTVSYWSSTSGPNPNSSQDYWVSMTTGSSDYTYRTGVDPSTYVRYVRCVHAQ